MHRNTMGKARAGGMLGGLAATLLIGAGALAAEPSGSNGANGKAVGMDGAAQTLLETRAAPYVHLRADIADIEAVSMSSAKKMRDAHNRLGSYDPSDLGGSWVAYAALVAADTPTFSAAIEGATKKKKARAAFLQRLRDNPASVRDLEGADAAMDAIRAVAARDATRINALGDRFIADASRMQNTAWAKAKIAKDGSTRLRASVDYAAKRTWDPVPVTAKALTKAGNTKPNLGADANWTPEWSPTSTPATEAEKMGALMTRALVLGARYAVGDIQPGHVDTYAKSRRSNKCFVNAKLNLDQCIAATRTPYEEAFCLGEHALNDVSRCVGWVANAGRVKE